jgi:hypothetical protein
LYLADTVIRSLHDAVTLRQLIATSCPNAISRLNTKLIVQHFVDLFIILSLKKEGEKVSETLKFCPELNRLLAREYYREIFKFCQITAAQLTKELPAFMGLECSLQCSQQPTSMSYLNHTNLFHAFKAHFNKVLLYIIKHVS